MLDEFRKVFPKAIFPFSQELAIFIFGLAFSRPSY